MQYDPIIFMFIGGMFLATNVFAYTMTIADSGQKNDIVLFPAKVEMNLLAGETKNVTLSVTNRHDQTLFFNVSAEDIAPANTVTESVKLIGNKEGLFPFKQFVSTEINEFTLASGQSIKFSVTLR